MSRYLLVECFAEAYKTQDGQDGTIIKVKKYMPDPDFNYALIDEAKKQEQYDDDNPL